MADDIKLINVNDFYDEEHVTKKVREWVESDGTFTFDKITSWTKSTGRLVVHFHWGRIRDEYETQKIQLIK
jgi:hypothetical protein